MTITEVIQQLEAQNKRIENMMNDSDSKLVDVFAELQRMVFLQTQVAILLKKASDDARVSRQLADDALAQAHSARRVTRQFGG